MIAWPAAAGNFALGLIAGLLPGNSSARPEQHFQRPDERRMARAVANGQLEVMRRLLRERAVDLLCEGAERMSWVQIAVACGQREALELLLEAGALGDPAGRIAGEALHLATGHSDPYWLERLWKAGADLNNRGGGCLLLETAMDSRRHLDFYLDHGAHIDGLTSWGGTVTLCAAELGRFDQANALLDRGANPWAMDAMGMTLGLCAEQATTRPDWLAGGAQDDQRRRLLSRLRALGFPQPAPTPEQALALRHRGHWPSR